MLKKTTLLFTLLLSQLLYADITGIGIAESQEVAKKEALADLSQNIKSEVRSNFESLSTQTSLQVKSHIKITSNLPILGAEFHNLKSGTDFKVIVNLISSDVNHLYTQKLQSLNSEVDSALSELKKIKSNHLKLKLYENIYSLLKDYDRYHSVATILGAKVTNHPKISKTQITTELLKLSSDIDSLEMASELLAKSFKQKGIFVYPPLIQNNTTVAEFGSVFLKELKANLHTTASLKSASYILVGEYTLSKNSMILNYELISLATNEVLNSKTISLASKVYDGLKTKPKGVDFNSLLNSGIVSSSNLKVSLNSSRGSENLLFTSGEDIELFVKLNKMGYLYIVGYTQMENEKISYLLELTQGDGNSKFIKFINADDASRWISLGQFSVEEPFGIESLQVIASNKKITSLPTTYYDNDSEYYIISKDIKKALSATRGLKKKKSKKIEMSEDVISFTTMQK